MRQAAMRRRGPGTRCRRAGFTLIELMIVISIIAVLATSVYPYLVDARKRGNEAWQIEYLRYLFTAQVDYRERDLDQDGRHQYATGLAQLAAVGKVDLPISASGVGMAKGFEITVGTLGDPEWDFYAKATPVLLGGTGDHSYWLDQSGVIRMSETTDVGPAWPPLQ